jgi:hypothetical protein
MVDPRRSYREIGAPGVEAIVDKRADISRPTSKP